MISLGNTALQSCIILISTVLISNGTEINGPIYDFNSAIIKFDPCVSILDKYNRFRYNDSGLLPLVAKVATKFTKIYIQISEIDIMEDLQTSVSRSPIAIAKYNRQHHGIHNFIKLEVWLTYSPINPETSYTDEFHKQPLRLAERLQALADEANAIYSGTITTLSLPVEVFPLINVTYNNFTYTPVNYKLGILIDSTACKFFPDYVIKAVRLLNVQAVILRTRYIFEDISQGNTVQRHDTTLQQCQAYLKNTSTTCFLVSVPDTYNHDTVKMAHMLSTWHQLLMWSIEKKVTLIFSEAFDTSCEQSIQRKTSGWWRLVENSTYESTKQFVFQEKAIIATEFDMLENPENYTWLHQDTKLPNKTYLGIIFSSYAVAHYLTEYPDDVTNILMKYIAAQYSKVVILLQDDGSHGSRFLLYEIQNVNKLRKDINNKTEVIVMIMPHIQFIKLLKSAGAKSVKKVTENIGIDTYLVSKYVLPYIGNETLEAADYTKNVLLAGLDKNKVKVAYSFNISICLSSQRFYNQDIDSLNNVLEDTETIWIYFEENDGTVKLGARRMFQQRVVLLEQCKEVFLNHFSNISIKHEFIFVMLHYSTQVKFYTNPWSLQNFVRYFDLLTDWANKTETTLIVSNAFDGARKLATRDAPVTEIGWWRFQQDSDLDLSNDKGNRRWVDKREDALLVSLLKFPEKNSESSLQTEYIVLIVLLPLLFSVVVIVMALYFMRRYYRETLLTKSEIYEFFLGSESVDAGNDDDECRKAHKAAYNKNRYEIDEKNFTINEGSALGSGEFGKVCQGKIVTDKGPLNVAIKTVNPEKIHKTTLNGMLSEIKLLSYIGKHINIIELIGANTAELKHGKIFIFLELCHLGCLEIYLRKLRPRDSCEELKEVVLVNQIQRENNQTTDVLQRYLNLTTMKKASLDSALSEDLYRWSKEICNGMAYLASKHVVHADLATRNVLLNLRKEAKICDFGLSRRMYNYTNYVKQQQEPLPWKWMSPESLKLMQFCEKSDVWAYGVTLWEIYSLGDSPYPGLSWDINFASLLESGFRLNEPTYNEENMYSIMKECWNTSAANRPSFETLLQHFN